MLQYDKMSQHEDISVRLDRILTGWEHFICVTSSECSLDMVRTASNLNNDTLHLSLKNQWPLENNNAKSHLVSLLDTSYRKLKQICKETSAMCRAVMDLVPNPWGCPILQGIMYKPDQVSHEACVSFCSMEHPDVLKARIEILMWSKHDELAYNLAVCCQQCGSPGGEAFYMEAIIILNYRLGNICRLTKEMSKMSCHSGVQFINRLLDVDDTSKLALAECLTQVLLVRDLVWASQFCCTADLMKLWVRLHVKSQTPLDSLKIQVKKVAALALTSAHQYLLVDVLYEQYGLDLMSLYIEVYVQAITMDINHLENVKLHEEHASILEMEAHLAAVFTKMAGLFGEAYCGVAKECILTAFTLEPTQERLDTLQSYSLCLQALEPDLPPVLSPIIIPTTVKSKAAVFPRIPCTGECYCEEKGKCRQQPPVLDEMQNSDIPDSALPSIDLMKMEKCWDLDDFSCIYPVHSPVLDSGLPNVSVQVLKDLVIILESARSKSATWEKEWAKLGPSCKEYLVTETECKRIILDAIRLKIPVEMPNRHFRRKTNSWSPGVNGRTEVSEPANVANKGELIATTGPKHIDSTKSLPPSSWTPVDILSNLALPKTFQALDNSMSDSDVVVDGTELKLVAKPEVVAEQLTLHVVPKNKRTRRVIKVNDRVKMSGHKEVIVNAPSGTAYIVNMPLKRPQISGDDSAQANSYPVCSSQIQQYNQACSASSEQATGPIQGSTYTIVAAPKLNFEGAIPKMVSDPVAINCQTIMLKPVQGQVANKRRSAVKCGEGQQKSKKKMFVSKKREVGNMWFSISKQHGLMEYKALKKDSTDGSSPEVATDTTKKPGMHVLRGYRKHERPKRAKVTVQGDRTQAKVAENVKGIVLTPSKLNIPSHSQVPQHPLANEHPQPPPTCHIPQHPVVESENVETIVVQTPSSPAYPCPMIAVNSSVPAQTDTVEMEVQQVVDFEPEVKRMDSPVSTTTVVIVEPPPEALEPKVKLVTSPKCVYRDIHSMPIIVSETSPVVILSPLKDKFRITNPICVLERLDAHVFTREVQTMKMKRERTKYDTILCDMCSKTFCSVYSLRRHMKTVHNLDPPPLKSARRSSSSSRKKMKSSRLREEVCEIPKCIEYVSNDTSRVMSSRETEEVVIDVKATQQCEMVDASAVLPSASPSCSSSSDEGGESCGPQSPFISRTVSVDDSLNSETEGVQPVACQNALRGENSYPCCGDVSPKIFKTDLGRLRQYRKPKTLE